MTHPNDRTVKACPNCDHAGQGLHRRVAPNEQIQRNPEKTYYCYKCGTAVDPIERPSKKARRPSESGTLARALEDASPSDIGGEAS